MKQNTFDYVVVGSGSGGSAVVGRLGSKAKNTVCLLEAGKSDNTLLIRVPFGLAALLPTRISNWGFQTEPQDGLNNRRGYQPRGKTLGGSSSINAMIYTRGNPWDYNHWAELGNKGWSYKDVLPYFKKSENNECGANDFHGSGGPLNVTNSRSSSPLGESFIRSAAECGFSLTKDFNGHEQEGFGSYQITQKDGQRWSAANAFIAPLASKDNVTILTKTLSTRILIKDKKAVGVAYRRNGREQNIYASKAVIICAGTFQSPQLLMLSGIGPANELKKLGIEVLVDSPGVGQNLQDHINYSFIYQTKSTDAIGISPRGISKLIKSIFEYKRYRKGLMTTNFAETGGFIKTSSNLNIPDVQVHFVIGIVDNHNRNLRLGHGYSCHFCLLRPKSRGFVALHNRNPLSAPLINPRFFAEKEDLDKMVLGYKITRRILESSAMSSYRGRELYPININVDDNIRQIIQQRADTVYHPVGTCKMGNDRLAVVDEKLRVRGLRNLFVADASIMPRIIGSNTNATAIMIGERAAEFIEEYA